MTVCDAFESQQCQNGCVDFDALARQHKDAVYRQMIRVCGNREDAEDVLIEALLKAYRHLDQLRESAAFRAWLAHALARTGRAALDTLRQQMKGLLNESIAALPEPYRSVYELCDVEDLRGDEVARRLGISRAAMKSRLHRARELVRTHLDAALAGQVLK